MSESARLIIVHWEWGPDTIHAGTRFWAAHSTDVDGRISDWPREGLIPIGAATCTVVDGEGISLLPPVAERTDELRRARGWGDGSVRPGRTADR